MSNRYIIFAIIYTIFIASVSSLPKSSLPGNDLLLSDSGSLMAQTISNLMHIPEYSLLTFLWLKAYRNKKGAKISNRNLALILFFLLLFAVSDEVHQSFVPGRSASFMDAGLDLLGILSGLWIYKHKVSGSRFRVHGSKVVRF